MKANTVSDYWSRVAVAGPDDCWEWQGCKNNKGYGAIGWNGKIEGSHRVSWMIENGTIPSGMYVLHKCDNRPCCNPKHLFLGTCLDNRLDMLAKGNKTGAPSGADNRRSKLNEEQARFCLTSGLHYGVLAKEFRVTPATVWHIQKRKTWKNLSIEEEAK